MACTNHEGKTVYVTVGSTGFDQLVQFVISAPILSLLSLLGYTRLLVQYGKSAHAFEKVALNETLKEMNPPIPVVIEGYAFKPSLREDMEHADLIISHAGSGSILESLRLHKPLVVVINNTLMDNHQAELAEELHSQGYLVYSSVSLLKTLKSRDYEKLKSFPEHDINRFATILDEEMGFEKNS